VVIWGWSPDSNGARLDVATNTWFPWAKPPETPPKVFQFAETPDRWLMLDADDSGNCPGIVTVHIFDKATGVWTTEPTMGVNGITIAPGTNHAVWTGSEVIIWDAACSAGAGLRYQPPAPGVH
jgi:hypothetical protein